MYILPGYTKYYEKDGSLYIFSQLLQNEVKLTTEELKNEFYKLVETGGVSDLSAFQQNSQYSFMIRNCY